MSDKYTNNMFILFHVILFETLAPSLKEQFQFNFKY
jgi:hypothetical protein